MKIIQAKSQKEKTKDLCSNDLEYLILSEFISYLDFDVGESNITIDFLSDILNLKKSSVENSILNLCKKGVLCLDFDTDIIYLEDKYYKLHPIWRKN
jgi:hypothetical protein